MERKSVTARKRAFTLIELLTVIAIIGLLIGLLVPGLAKARDSAKATKSRAAMKSLGDGLEMFRSDNDEEVKGGGYPSSRAGDDPTFLGKGETWGSWGTEDISGAQWLVRYLVGKRQDGYVAKRFVPRQFWGDEAKGQLQVGWYGSKGVELDPDGHDVFPGPDWNGTPPDDGFGRAGPYVTSDSIKIKAPKDLPMAKGATIEPSKPRYKNQVFLDAFDFPILYYAANTQHSATAKANPATYHGYECEGGVCIGYPGVFTFRDNALFTGLCEDTGTCTVAQWDFGSGDHKLVFGPWSTAAPADWKAEIENYPNSFPYYVLNKSAFDANGAIVASRKDTFILISPGKDGLFGTADDIRNY